MNKNKNRAIQGNVSLRTYVFYSLVSSKNKKIKKMWLLMIGSDYKKRPSIDGHINKMLGEIPE